jgi:hypothetical protein
MTRAFARYWTRIWNYIVACVRVGKCALSPRGRSSPLSEVYDQTVPCVIETTPWYYRTKDIWTGFVPGLDGIGLSYGSVGAKPVLHITTPPLHSSSLGLDTLDSALYLSRFRQEIVYVDRTIVTVKLVGQGSMNSGRR